MRRKNCFELNDETLTIDTQTVGLHWFKNKKPNKIESGSIDFIFIMFPSGKEGYRIEIEGEELGTIYYNDKEKRFKFINW